MLRVSQAHPSAVKRASAEKRALTLFSDDASVRRTPGGHSAQEVKRMSVKEVRVVSVPVSDQERANQFRVETEMVRVGAVVDHLAPTVRKWPSPG
jgi:hypothetical protein